MQKIHMPSATMPREHIKEVITECVSKSDVRDGVFRYYMSAGIGNGQPLFYAIVEEGIPVKPINGCKDLYFKYSLSNFSIVQLWHPSTKMMLLE